MRNPAHGCAFAFALLCIALPARAEQVRVKIFPHNSKFTTPQGKEAVMDKLRLTTKGSCTQYLAPTGSAADEITYDRPVATGNTFAFEATDFGGPFWLECTEPAALVREGFKNSNRYLGRFFIKKIMPDSGAPYLTVVNVLEFEDYLKAVVPAEMEATWPAEALKAQAVAARTYALFELAGDPENQDPKIIEEKSGAQLDDTVFFQAYQGVDWQTAATNDAVEKTAGISMRHENRIIKAYFHGDSGGHTEDSAQAFDIPLPYCVGRQEIYTPGSVPNSSWTVQTTLLDAQKKLIEYKALPAGTELESLTIRESNILPSQRVAIVTAKLKNGSFMKIGGKDFRFALGLKSTWFRLQTGKALTITGKGWGHGAGMSQWGARLMATQLKKNYADILKFYYTGITLSRP